jgi:hypothetical protein
VYFQVHRPELTAGSTEAGEAVMEQGQQVGLEAQKAFPGGVLVAAGRIAARQHFLEEVTEDMRRQRRQVKFKLAVEERTARLHGRRGKAKWNLVCPACGFNRFVYSAEAATKKAVRSVMKAAVRLTAKAAWLTAKATWEISMGTAKVLWWSLTPTKKRFSKIPAAV